MNPMQIMAMLQNSGNPMMMLTQLAQQNPRRSERLMRRLLRSKHYYAERL